MKKMLIVASTRGHLKQFHLPYIQECSRYFQVDLAFPDPIPSAFLTVNGEEIPISFVKKYTTLDNWRALQQLVSLLKQKNYDTIVTHTTLASFLVRLALKYSGKNAYVVCVVHGYLFHEKSNVIKKNILLSAEKLVKKQTDVVLTMNTWDTNMAKKHKLGKEVYKISGIGINMPEISESDAEQCRKINQLPTDKFLVMYGGEFSKGKNQKFLLEIWKELPDNAHLILAGVGDLWEESQELAEKMGLLHRIHFLGYVTPLPHLYYWADLVVSSSEKEGLPFHVMEAMSLRKPLLLSDIKGHRDLVVSDKVGQLFSLEHPQDFVEKFLKTYQQWTEGNSEPCHFSKRIIETQYQLSEVFPVPCSYYLRNIDEY